MNECGQCRSEIRLYVLCSLILIYTVHKNFNVVISKERVEPYLPEQMTCLF